MSRWFRMHDCILDDPKVQRLPGDLFKTWVNLLCVASRNDGRLPGIADLAFMLRTSEEAIADDLDSLMKFGLIDNEDGYVPHNWNERQYKSDVSTDRVKRFRERSTKQAKPVSETPPEADTDQSQKQTQNGRAISEIADFRQAIWREFERAGSPNKPDNSRAAIWLERGWKPAICLAVIAEILARKKSVSSLGYFENAIADAHQAPQANPANAPKPYVSPVVSRGHWVPEPSEAGRAWVARYPGVWKSKREERNGEWGAMMPTEFPPASGAAA